MYKFVEGFLGVFSPKGELEAIEDSPEMAKHAAFNLSPGEKPGKAVTRTIAPVLVFVGDWDEFAKACSEGVVERHKIRQRTSAVGPQPFKGAQPETSI